MLGKSFYVLLTERDPLYLLPDGVHPAIFSVIERCCALDKNGRYQDVYELKQAIVAAYDVILNRVEGFVQCRQMLEAIMERLRTEQKYSSKEIAEFLDTLGRLEFDEQESICQDLEPRFFRVVAQEPFVTRHGEFLTIYDKMVRNGDYGWSFAERIADCMSYFLKSDNATPKVKAAALDMAIHAAVTENRFAAMHTCTHMITSVESDDDAIEIRNVIQRYPDTFVAQIEPVRCNSDLIVTAIRALRKSNQA